MRHRDPGRARAALNGLGADATVGTRGGFKGFFRVRTAGQSMVGQRLPVAYMAISPRRMLRWRCREEGGERSGLGRGVLGLQRRRWCLTPTGGGDGDRHVWRRRGRCIIHGWEGEVKLKLVE